MQELLEEFIASHSFYEVDCGDLSWHAQLAAAYERGAQAKDSLSRAAERLAVGDVRPALDHLLYAQRQAPSNSLITLVIGETRLHLGIAEATEPFELLARRSGWNGAWYRLVLSHFRRGHYELAALQMHEALRLNAPLVDPASLKLAAAVARQTGAAGWCGVNNDGELLIGGQASAVANAELSVVLDGEAVHLGRRKSSRRDAVCRFNLGPGLLRGTSLRVTSKNTPLIGSPVVIRSVTRMEGFVDRDHGAITGWCWLPGEPSFQPRLTITRPSGQEPLFAATAAELIDSADNLQSFAWQRRFDFAADALPEGMLSVRGMLGANLYGSPLNPNGACASAMHAAGRLARRFPASSAPAIEDQDEASEVSIPASHRGRRGGEAQTRAAARDVLVAIPVYRGFETTMRCIESVLRHRQSERVLVISDASPDPRIVKHVESLASQGSIELRQEVVNRGFPSTANLALREAAAAGLDIVLLNSDTIVSAGWLERLREAAYAAADIGTATPFSNSATILSYPSRTEENAVPDVGQVDELAAAFFEANGATVVEIPTGHGFCLYIRHSCLVETGVFRDDVFAQGYGEENDFCLRARHLGWRHVAAAGVYVGHVEGQSFAKGKGSLVQRNLATLNMLHPGYDRLIAEWEGEDPLADCRRRVDWLRLARKQGVRSAVCFVTHAREGGVLRQVQTRAMAVEQRDLIALILQPATGAGGERYCEIHSPSDTFPNLRFHIRSEATLFVAFLKERFLDHIEIHHFIGHDSTLIGMMSRLGVPFDIHLHDYSWFCPRITLTSYDNRYCGEPDVKVCEACVKDRGGAIEWDISPRDLMIWSQDLLTRARAIVAPSADTAARFERRFSVNPKVVAWEAEDRPVQLRHIPVMAQGRVRRICIAGAIGYEKGYEVILGCARHAVTHGIPIEFQIVGFTCDDERLIETGKVTITGRYDENEAVSLIRRQDADFGFLPALWPETWSFVLSQLWEASLPVVAFDIGAQGERIRRSGAGLVLPINLPIGKLVQSLCRVSS